jgi:hypothetical protein
MNEAKCLFLNVVIVAEPVNACCQFSSETNCVCSKLILFKGRPGPRQGHRHYIMRLNFGLSTGIRPHLPSIFVSHITEYWDKSTVYGAHTGLVRTGYGFGPNKRILGGPYTNTEWISTKMPPQCGTFRLVSSPPCTSTRGYPAEYEDWTTNAAGVRNCLCRRHDGFRHTPRDLHRNTAGSPDIRTGDGGSPEYPQIQSAPRRGMAEAPNSSGCKFPWARRRFGSGIRSHCRSLHKGQLGEGYECCASASATCLR